MANVILERCKPIAPELLNADGCFEVLAICVGLRPSRHGGPRVELDLLDNDTQGRFVCHCYVDGLHYLNADQFPTRVVLVYIYAR
jgi:hypothetical protein